MKKIMFALICMLMIAAVSAKDLVVSSAEGDLDVTVEFNTPLTRMTGSVSQSDAPVSDALFQYFCQDYSVISELSGPVESYITTTNSTGEFEYFAVEKKCEYGDNAWVVVTFNDVEYTSEKFSITKDGSGNSNVGIESESVSSVPEFSSVTLGITMLGAGFVFAMLRKR